MTIGWSTTETAPRPAGGRQRAPWSFREVLSTIALGFVIAIVVLVLGTIGWSLVPSDFTERLSSETLQVAALGSAFYLSLGLATWIVIVRRKRLPWSSLGFVPVSPKILLAMVPAGFVLLVLNALLLAPISFLFGLGDEDRAAEQQASFTPSGDFPVIQFVGLFLLLAVLAPLIEELLFRGLLYGYLRGRTGVVVSVLVSALVFAVLHVVIPPLFVMGAILAVLSERTRSIWPAIVLHATNNGLIVVIIVIASLAD